MLSYERAYRFPTLTLAYLLFQPESGVIANDIRKPIRSALSSDKHPKGQKNDGGKGW